MPHRGRAGMLPYHAPCRAAGPIGGVCACTRARGAPVGGDGKSAGTVKGDESPLPRNIMEGMMIQTKSQEAAL